LLNKDSELTVLVLKDADVHACRNDDKPVRTVLPEHPVDGSPLHMQKNVMSCGE
jgi:hypothetical protein